MGCTVSLQVYPSVEPKKQVRKKVESTQTDSCDDPDAVIQEYLNP